VPVVFPVDVARGQLRVASKFEPLPAGAIVIDTTAKSGTWSALSPFLLPGGRLYGDVRAVNVENGWQYTKVYSVHADAQERPTDAYWEWAQAGWANPTAVRYPMGKGARPLYALWRGDRLGYLDARKRIYAPLYARAVVRTDAFAQLAAMLSAGQGPIYLRDYDGYDHLRLGASIADVIHNPRRKMGHAFVLWMLLTGYNVAGEFDADRWLRNAQALTPTL
jgi:hypothetical protein